MNGEPLEQFRQWYDSRHRASLDSQSEYVKYREAFYAGFTARPAEPIPPSRDALTADASYDYRERGRHPLAGPSPETLNRVREAAEFRRAYGGPPAPRPYSPEGLAELAHEQYRAPEPHSEAPPGDVARIAPDYIQQGTVTGRIPPLPEPIGPSGRLAQYTQTVWSGEQDRTDAAHDRFDAAWGAPGPVPAPVETADG